MSFRAASSAVRNVLVSPRRINSGLSLPAAHRVGTYTTAASNKIPVRIVEVGPRDGLQNEKTIISPDVKVGLINRLGHAGSTVIEAGSFVSPKWVPQVCVCPFGTPSCAYMPTTVQMAGTAEIVVSMEKLPGVTYQVLVPNEKGLENVVSLLAAHPRKPPIDEIAVFTAATDAFSLANTNVTVAESLKRLARVVQGALDKGIRVRGYVSVVIACPYSGKVDYNNVRDVTKELLDMGCYEVSLGDTTGMGNPTSVNEMLNVTLGANPVEKLAGHVRSMPPRVILPSHHRLVSRYLRHGSRQFYDCTPRGYSHPGQFHRWPRWLPILAGGDRKCRYRRYSICFTGFSLLRAWRP
jgi:hydroxymethylglutaryl-CoA lyase